MGAVPRGELPNVVENHISLIFKDFFIRARIYLKLDHKITRKICTPRLTRKISKFELCGGCSVTINLVVKTLLICIINKPPCVYFILYFGLFKCFNEDKIVTKIKI